MIERLYKSTGSGQSRKESDLSCMRNLQLTFLLILPRIV